MEIKDKPNSMSVREWITKKVALSSTVPENVIRQVVAHQFDSANDALENFNSIEISGFGKFYYNKTKAKKELEYCKEQATYWKERCFSEDITKKKRQQAEAKLQMFLNKIEWLKNKENGAV